MVLSNCPALYRVATAAAEIGSRGPLRDRSEYSMPPSGVRHFSRYFTASSITDLGTRNPALWAARRACTWVTVTEPSSPPPGIYVQPPSTLWPWLVSVTALRMTDFTWLRSDS